MSHHSISAAARRFAAWLLALAVLVPGAALAQGGGEDSVEGRLLQILRQKGIIDDSELRELRELEEQLRAESALEARLAPEIDQMVSAIADDAISTSYKPGSGFTWQTADKKFKLNVGGRIQVRFTYDFFDKNEAINSEREPDFDVPRARIWLKGHAFEEYWGYQIQFDVAGDEADTSVMGSTLSSQNRLTELKDAFLEFTKWREFMVRGGQFKVPYSRHQLTSSGKLEFVDRAITDSVFARGRDVGLMVFGELGPEDNRKLIEYYAGAFDGEGENRSNNDSGLLWAARIVVNPFGEVPYSESDTKYTEDFRLAVGVNAWLHNDDNHLNQSDDWAVGLDVAIFCHGFFATGELHYRENDVLVGDNVEIVGWMAQIGYMIIAKELEVALRAANIDWDNPTSDTARREYLVVVGYFFHDHNLKVQMDFGRVEEHELDTDDNIDDWRFRLQIQLVF